MSTQQRNSIRFCRSYVLSCSSILASIMVPGTGFYLCARPYILSKVLDNSHDVHSSTALVGMSYQVYHCSLQDSQLGMIFSHSLIAQIPPSNIMKICKQRMKMIHEFQLDFLLLLQCVNSSSIVSVPDGTDLEGLFSTKQFFFHNLQKMEMFQMALS